MQDSARVGAKGSGAAAGHGGCSGAGRRRRDRRRDEGAGMCWKVPPRPDTSLPGSVEPRGCGEGQRTRTRCAAGRWSSQGCSAKGPGQEQQRVPAAPALSQPRERRSRSSAGDTTSFTAPLGHESWCEGAASKLPRGHDTRSDGKRHTAGRRHDARTEILVWREAQSLAEQRAGLGWLLYSPLTIYRIYRCKSWTKMIYKMFFQ